MKLVAARPSPDPLPDSIRMADEAIRRDELRADVERIAVPRVFGTPENAAVGRVVIELFAQALRLDEWRAEIRVDDAGNVIVGDPRRARILIGAHFDCGPRHAGGRRQRQWRGRPDRRRPGDRPARERLLRRLRRRGMRLRGQPGARWLGSGHIARSRSMSWRWSASPVGSRARRRTRPSHPDAHRRRFPGCGRHARVSGGPGSCPVHGRSHSVPVQGLYLPDVPLEMIEQVSAAPAPQRSCPVLAAGPPGLDVDRHGRVPQSDTTTGSSDTPDTLDYEFLAERHEAARPCGALGSRRRWPVIIRSL